MDLLFRDTRLVLLACDCSGSLLACVLGNQPSEKRYVTTTHAILCRKVTAEGILLGHLRNSAWCAQKISMRKTSKLMQGVPLTRTSPRQRCGHRGRQPTRGESERQGTAGWLAQRRLETVARDKRRSMSGQSLSVVTDSKCVSGVETWSMWALVFGLDARPARQCSMLMAGS